MKMLLLASFMLTGCMSTKIVLNDRYDARMKPVYEDYFDGWWWGLSGQAQVSLQKVCMDQRPYAVRRVKGAEDIALTVITLGIYSPTTIQVWCGE